MPHHCAVPMCTSNSKTSPGLSFHGFPRDPVLKATWLRNIRRDEASGCFQVNSSTRVCSLHFLESDYHGSGRQRNRQTSRQNSFLKRDSVPTKFDCFPERLRRPADQGANKRKAPTERLEPPPKKRKNTSKGKASEPSQGSTADSNETNPGWTMMFLLRVQLRQHLIYTKTVMVLITTLLQVMVGALRRAVINTIIVIV